MSTKTRIIGLGNTIRSDDGVGIHAARAIRERLGEAVREVDVVESDVAGFALLELMEGWDRVILIDAIQLDDAEPGTVMRIAPDDLKTTVRIRSVHEIDLPTALEMARRLEMRMPDQILIFAVQAHDCLTLGERMSDPVERGCARVVEMVLEEISGGTCAAS